MGIENESTDVLKTRLALGFACKSTEFLFH
jgi:hypothetical protein